MLYRIMHLTNPHGYKAIILTFALTLLSSTGFSQVDSTKKELKFDFGITRDRNINIWPIFKRTSSNIESDKQLFFPIYRSYENFKLKEKRSHLLPFYWKDSSNSVKNFRIISTFYPSLYHTSINYKENTKTFTLLEFAPYVNILEFKKSPDGLVMQNNLLFFLWYKNNQLTKKSHLVVFPAYWQFVSPLRQTHTLFPIYSYGKYAKLTKSYLAVTPLFWNFNSPKRSSNLLFPIWWNRTIFTSSDSIRSNLVFPIYYSHSNKFTNHKVLFPIVWSINNSRYKSLTIAPILSFGHGINTNRSHLMLTPLYWQFIKEESKSRILFPFVWTYSWHTRFDSYNSFVFFPVYWYKSDDRQKSTTIFPLVWSRTSPEYHSFTFIPLLSTGKSPDNTLRHLAVTPIFWHVKSGNITTNTLLPIWFYRKNIDGNNVRINNILFPLYWGWQRDSYQGNILFPILWRFKNPNYRSFSIAPLMSFGKSSDGKKSYAAITPFYWRFRTAEGKGQLLFPLWWERTKTTEGDVQSSSQVIFLYWKYKDSERKHQGVFPLVWKFKDQSRSSFTFFPLVSTGQRDNNERKYLAVSPIFWHFKNQQRTFNTLFPLWWSKNDYSNKNAKHFKLLIPIYFSQWDTIRTRRVVFPIVWQFKNPRYNSFTFVPLFSHGRTPDKSVNHLAITPLFWHFKNQSGSTTTLLPLFWRSKYGEGDFASERTILAPIYFYTNNSDNQNTIIFPIIWKLDNRDYSSLTIAPLFSFGRNDNHTRSHYVITPLYYNIKKPNSSSRILFPIWWNIRKSGNNYSNKDVLFPIYWSLQNQHRSAKVLFPIVWNFKSAKSNSFTFIPFFSKGKSKNGLKHLAVTPLFWRFEDDLMQRTILFPLFTSYNDKNSNSKFDLLLFLFRNSRMNGDTSISIVWPIIERSKSKDYKYFRFAPLVWSKRSPSFSYFTIQPFFYQNKSKVQTTSRILWELYVHRNTYGVKKTNQILWKFLEWNKYTNGDKEFRILHLLYANSKVDGKVEKSLFPIYYLTKDSNGNKSLSVMLYFYNSLKRKIPNTTEYYQEERIFWLIRIRSNYRILKEKGIDID
ncbi:MAG: hypothetical protein AB7S48_08280 [Bacteroidales bacterium]